MLLLDLTTELLMLIAEHIGAIELRKSVSYLLIARRWYQAALPTYLSGIPLRDVYLSSYEFQRLPPPGTPLWEIIEAKAVRLSLRLLGHPSRQIATRPWHINAEDSDDESMEEEDDETQCEEWMVAGPKLPSLETQSKRKPYTWDAEMEQSLRPWRAGTNYLISELASTLSDFQKLEELSLEASSELEAHEGPLWDYVFDSSIKDIISNLPTTLTNLTLDTCGSNIISPNSGKKSLHFCPLIAERLHGLQNVRLRMRCICPKIFDVSSIQGAASKLKTLVIRLSLPYFQEASYENDDGNSAFDVQPCKKEEERLEPRAIVEIVAPFRKRIPSL
ncbi:hypothetical protein MMC28_006408 [Mycoblastus sanguinarius]|nr:hypothetical protein [Mycoblastus sanguinarius]